MCMCGCLLFICQMHTSSSHEHGVAHLIRAIPIGQRGPQLVPQHCILCIGVEGSLETVHCLIILSRQIKQDPETHLGAHRHTDTHRHTYTSTHTATKVKDVSFIPYHTPTHATSWTQCTQSYGTFTSVVNHSSRRCWDNPFGFGSARKCSLVKSAFRMKCITKRS